MTKIVRVAFPDSRLTPVQRRRMEKLANRPDSEIDYSDIPPLTQKFWQNAVRNPFYRPVKKQLTLRLDADVIAWLRRQGKGYQTRANALLRDAMLGEVTMTKTKNRARSRMKTTGSGSRGQTRRAS